MPTVPQSNLVAANNLGQNTPSSPAQVGLVVGPTAIGTVNQIILDSGISTILQNFDSGPGSEVAATALVEPSPGTVYQIKTPTSIAGTVGSVTKTAGVTLGTAVDDFGAILVPGAAFNGDVLFAARQQGAQLSIAVGGAEAVAVTGLLVALTVTTASTGTTLAALHNGNAGALALWGAVAQGSGASVCGQALATYTETSGRIQFQALAPGMTFDTVVGTASTAASSAALTGGGTNVHVILASNANSEPVLPAASAQLVQSALVTLANSNPGLFKTTLAGSGGGLLGAKASTALPFGSGGTMTVSGAPNDGYQVSVQIAQPGGLGAGAFTVSLGNAKGLPLYNGTFQIPSGGTFVIADTGLTLTFAGTFDLFDTYTFTCIAPQSTLSDVVAALTYFLARPERAALIAVAGEIAVVNLPAWVVALQSVANQLEAAKKFCAIMLEYAGPASGQTNGAWATQVGGILANLTAPRICVFGGEGNAEAALPLPQPGRFEVCNGNRFMFARALALPSAVDVTDQTLSGAASAVLEAYQTDTAPALAAARSSYFYLLSGVAGVQMDGVMLDSPTGDYTRLVVRRVIDDVCAYAAPRQALKVGTAQLRNKDGTLALSSKIALQDAMQEYLRQKFVPGSATDIQVVVDGTNTDGTLRYTYYVQLLYYIYTINGRVGAVKSLRFSI